MGELCARFDVSQPDTPGGRAVIYVKSRWFATKFSLAVTDGLDAWIGEVPEEEVSRKAFSWDCTVVEYLEAAAKYLGVQEPTSSYSFISQENEGRKLSWTLVRDGVELVASWKVEKAPYPKEITCDILDNLMRGSSRLSEDLQRKRRSLEQQKAEADRCLAQSLKFRDEKLTFEEEVYKKFVAVLNSKKDKIRELKEQVIRLSPVEVDAGRESEDDFGDTDKEEDEVSKEDTIVKTAGRDADQDSGATEVLPDSPTAENSSVNHSPAHSRSHDSRQIEGSLNASAAQSSSVQPPIKAVSDPATFLGGSTYTSAPKKRRKQ